MSLYREDIDYCINHNKYDRGMQNITKIPSEREIFDRINRMKVAVSFFKRYGHKLDFELNKKNFRRLLAIMQNSPMGFIHMNSTTDTVCALIKAIFMSTSLQEISQDSSNYSHYYNLLSDYFDYDRGNGTYNFSEETAYKMLTFIKKNMQKEFNDILKYSSVDGKYISDKEQEFLFTHFICKGR